MPSTSVSEFEWKIAPSSSSCGAVTAVRQVAVWHEPRRIMEAGNERLDVVRGAGAGRGVTAAWDAPVAFEPFDFALIAEHLGEQSESAVAALMAVIVGDDAGTFLTAMRSAQAEIGKSGGVGVAPHAEDATFLVNVFLKFSRQAKALFKQGINYLSALPIGGVTWLSHSESFSIRKVCG